MISPDTSFPAAPTPPTPLFESQSFYVSLLTYVLPIITLIFHRDFNGDVQVVATAAAGTATAIVLVKKAYENVTHQNAVAAYTAQRMNIAHENARVMSDRAYDASREKDRIAGYPSPMLTISGPSAEDILITVQNGFTELTEQIHMLVTPAPADPKVTKKRAPRKASAPLPVFEVEESVGTGLTGVYDVEESVKVVPAPKKAAAKTVGRGQTVNGRKADGSIDLRTKEGRALKAAEEVASAPQKPAKKAPAKKTPAKAGKPSTTNVLPLAKPVRAVRPQARNK